MSGNQTQKIITFIVTEEGDTADVIIDEEALCPDSVEPDSSEEESSEESSSNEEASSEEEASEDETESEEVSSNEQSEVASSESSQEESTSNIIAKKEGCSSAMSAIMGLPVLALGVCTLCKRKKD